MYPGVSPAALSSSYVLAANDQEAALMVRYLGVQAPTAAQVYRTDILPQLSTFSQAVRDDAMLLMLRHLSDLQQQDRGFTQLLSQTPFLPSGKGELHVPNQLYDPRSPELVALLDPDACFPAPAFCGDVLDSGQDEQQQQHRGSGFSSLAVLQQLGLRSSAQLDTLVAAARYVEKVAADGDEDMAVARGKVCCSCCRIAAMLVQHNNTVVVLNLAQTQLSARIAMWRARLSRKVAVRFTVAIAFDNPGVNRLYAFCIMLLLGLAGTPCVPEYRVRAACRPPYCHHQCCRSSNGSG